MTARARPLACTTLVNRRDLYEPRSRRLLTNWYPIRREPAAVNSMPGRHTNYDNNDTTKADVSRPPDEKADTARADLIEDRRAPNRTAGSP